MKVCAIDVSASSLRVLKVTHENGHFSYETAYRAPNPILEENGHYVWDQEAIYQGIAEGIKKAVEEDSEIASVGIDTWGVDYVLLNKKGEAIRKAYCYRDSRCTPAMEDLLKKHPQEEIYAETGIQRCDFNSIFQLHDDIALHPVDFASFLFMPDYLCYRLTDEKKAEVTEVSTGAIYDPRKRDYSTKCLAMLGKKKGDMYPLIAPGETYGIIKRRGLPRLPVIAVCSHDTASAIASMPLNEHSFYISSGTWSLLGTELRAPFISEETRRADFTNEIGYQNRVCFLKNIMGFFMIQELRHQYGDPAFSEILKQADAAPERGLYINVDDAPFAHPGEMKEKILAYLDKTNQHHDDLSLGDLAKIVYDSLAIKYAEKIKELEKLVAYPAEDLVVTGGGTNIPSLLQKIADYSGLTVKTAEAEATAYGNAIVQMIALGEFTSLEEARHDLAQSSPRAVYEPHPSEKTAAIFAAYQKAIQGD